MSSDAENVGRTLMRAQSLPSADISDDSISPSEIQRQYDQETYKMNHTSRGVALIINVMNFDNKPELTRYGSDEDVKRLKKVLGKDNLKFNVMESENTDLKSIRKDLQAVSDMNHTDSDCLMICIMTHGGRNGTLSASDQHFELEKELRCFMKDECKSLIGKPKFFIVQACRGNLDDKGVKYRGHAFDASHYVGDFLIIPSSADQLIMYATYEGYKSYRTIFGTWFIQELCKHLGVNKTDDLASILTTVTRKISLKEIRDEGVVVAKQLSVIATSLTKKVFFHDSDLSQLPQDRNTVLGKIEQDEAVQYMTDTAESFSEAAKNIGNAAQRLIESVNSFRIQSNRYNPYQAVFKAPKTST